MITQIAYLSRSVHPMGHETDDIILKTAQARNAQKGLTGFLFRTQHSFLQVLEGEEDAVKEVMDMIRSDGRHEITIEWPAHQVAERAFPGWNMGHGPLGREDVTDMMDPKSEDDETWAAMIAKLRDIAMTGA